MFDGAKVEGTFDPQHIYNVLARILSDAGGRGDQRQKVKPKGRNHGSRYRSEGDSVTKKTIKKALYLTTKDKLDITPDQPKRLIE